MNSKCVPVTGSVRGPPLLSSPPTHIHTVGASVSPSFPQTAHSTTPTKKFKHSHKQMCKSKHNIKLLK